MKNKNPLYVVKGKTVQEADGLMDLILKKLNLEPLITILQKVFQLLLKQVTNYSTFIVVKKTLDEMLTKVVMVMGRVQSTFS
jgi:hypothetical protein